MKGKAMARAAITRILRRDLPALPEGTAKMRIFDTQLSGFIADLLRLQKKLIDTVTPYTVKTATAAAFYTTPSEPNINQSVIDYIATSMADLSGDKFSPHVTIGIGTTEFLDALLAEPFAAFTFSPAAATVYQFGDYGTARKRLKVLSEKN